MVRPKQQSSKGKKRKAVELEQKPADPKPIIQIQEEDFPRGGQELLSQYEKQRIKQAAQEEFQAELFQAKKQKLGHSGWKVLNSFSYVPGVKVWGIIESVTPKGLLVSLPCGVKGYAEVQQCSDVLARLLGSVEDEEAEKIRRFITDFPSLNQLFYPGQYVRGVVLQSQKGGEDSFVDVEDDQEPADKQQSQSPHNRKIQLCLKVEEVNKGLSKLLLQAGMQLAACVRTIEEKGFTLTFGIGDTEGFLSVKSFREKFGPQASLLPGQIIDVTITKTVSKKKGSMLAKVECCPEASRTKILSDFPGQTIYNMIPGGLVKAKITSIEPAGITVEFLEYFKGIVQYSHIGCSGNITDSFKIGDKIRGRIIYVNGEEKVVRISMLPHLVNYHTPPQPPPLGTFFKDVSISHYLTDQAAFVNLKMEDSKQEMQGIITIFNMSDDELSTQQRKTRFKTGSVLESVRMVSYRLFDGAVMLSCKKSVLEAVIMSTEDVHPGQHFKDLLVEKVYDDGSLRIKLASNVVGRVLKEYVFDNMSTEHVELREVQKRFKEGSSRVDCQVLSSNAKGRIFLTMKKPQIQSKLPLLTDLAAVEIGKKYHGVVKKVLPAGLLIEFYQHIMGIAPIRYLPLEPNQSLGDVYKVGQVVKCSVVTCYPQDRKITLSLISKKKLSEIGKSRQSLEGLDLLVGQIVAGKVKWIQTKNEDEEGEGEEVTTAVKKFVLDVVDENDDEYEGVLEESHLTDHLSLVGSISEKIQVGSIFPALLVLNVNRRSKRLHLSRKPSLVTNKDQIPKKFEDFKQYSCVTGYVNNAKQDAVYVEFLQRVRGRSQANQLADINIQHPQDAFEKGQTVRAFVHGKIEEGEKIHLNLKGRTVGCSKREFLENYFKDLEFSCSLDEDEETQQIFQIVQQLKIGDYIEGKIHEKKPYGVLCDLNVHEDLVGLITSDHIPDETLIESGTTFGAKILDLNFERGIVDLTLLPRLIQPINIREDVLMSDDDGENEKPKNYEIATIELTKIEQGYIIVSTKDGQIMRCPIHDYNTQKIYKPQFELFEEIRGNIDESDLNSLFIVRDEQITRKMPLEFQKKIELTVGKKYSGKIIDIYGDRVTVGISVPAGKFFKCLLHASEIEDSDDSYFNSEDSNQLIFESVPFGDKFSIGDIVQVVYLRQFFQFNYFKLDTKTSQLVSEASIRPSVLNEESQTPRIQIADIEPGMILIGYLHSIVQDQVYFQISGEIMGRMLAIEFSDFEKIKSLQIGTPMKVKVMEVNEEKFALELCTAETKKLKKVKLGDIVEGQLDITHLQHNIYIRQRFGRVFYVDFMNLFDFWRSNVLDGLQSGLKVRGKVIKLGKSKSRQKTQNSSASLKVSDGGWIQGMEHVYNQSESCEQIEEVTNAQLEVGNFLKGYVQMIGGLGVFVRVRAGVSGRVRIGQVCDRYINEEQLKQMYNVGDMVVAKVISKISFGGDDTDQQFLIQMSLKTRDESNWLTIEDFNVGDIVKGKVNNIVSYGVFVKLEKSNLNGLAHISKICDEKLESVEGMFEQGQEVKCMIVKIDKENKKIELSLNRKYFGEEEEEQKKDVENGEDEGCKDNGMDVDVDEMMLHEMDVDEDEQRAEYTTSEEEKDFTPHPWVQIQSPAGKGKVSEDEDEDEDEDMSDELDEESDENGMNGVTNGGAQVINPEEQSIEIEDTNTPQSVEETGTEEEEKEEEDDESEEEEEEDSDVNDSDEGQEDDGSGAQEEAKVDAGEKNQKRGWEGLELIIKSDTKDDDVGDEDEKQELTKAEKKRQKAERELQIRNKELERLHGDQAPKSSEDYERLLVSSPNSSYVWIQYMAYQISLGESENARKTAERALETIHFREEHEKFNVWIAYLNLEYQFGDNRDAFNQLLSRALVHTNQKKLYLAVIDIVQNDDELVIPIFKTMCRKFKESCKVWLRRVRHSMAHKEEDGNVSKKILKVLQDARKVLPDKKYTKLMIRVALLEFQEGEAERGRGMMEGLLQKFPKRLDLWSQYIDKEIKIGEQQKIRALFERATHLQLPPKKMKFLFKRYLQYEKDYGNEDTINYVKQQALKFVEKLKG